MGRPADGADTGGAGAAGADGRRAWTERYGAIIEALADGALLRDHRGNLLTASRAAMDLFGVASLDGLEQVLQHGDAEVLGEEDQEIALATLGPGEEGIVLKLGDSAGSSERRWVRVRVDPLEVGGASTELWSLSDVTALVEAERRVERLSRMYAMLAATNEAMVRAADDAEILEAVCRIAVEVGHLPLAWIGFVQDGLVVPSAFHGLAGYAESLRLPVDDPSALGPTGLAVLHGEPVTSDDVLTDERMRPWRPALTEMGIRSSCAVPLRRETAVTGSLNVYSREPRAFDEEEVRLLLDLAADLSFALSGLDADRRSRAAEAALRASEARFRALVQRASDVVAVLDEGSVVTFMSPSVERITGWPPEHYVGQSGLDAMHPDDAGRAASAIAEALSRPGHAPFVVEARAACADGTWRWCEYTGANLLDVPEVAGIVVNFRDVSERHERDEQLRFQARLLGAVGDAIVATGVDGRVVYWNDAAEALFGWERDAAVGRSIEALGLFDAGPGDREAVVARLGDGEAWTSEVSVRRPDGTDVHVLLTIRPVSDDAGDLTTVILAAVDIGAQVRAAEELARRAAIQAELASLGRSALVDTDLDSLLTLASERAAAILGVESVKVLEVRGDLIHVRAAVGYPEELGREPVPVDEELPARHVLRSGQPMVFDDLDTEERFVVPDRVRAAGIRSSAGVVIEGRGEPFGLLVADASEAHRFSSNDVNALQNVANIVAAAVERLLVEQELAKMALEDPLTGLANRTLFGDRLRQQLARREHGPIGVLYLDLDRFKVVNDSLGHSVGDELLGVVARRLEATVRREDTVARLGGDEFSVLCEGLEVHELADLAERALEAIAAPVEIAGTPLVVTASIGLAMADRGSTPEFLLRDADAAMYRAKDLGRARVEMFDEELRTQAVARLTDEAALRQALERDELVVHYHPEVDLRSGEVVVVEALARWERPGRGLLAPVHFIPLAEDIGLIGAIGERVLDLACAQAAAWRQAGLEVAVAVNVSAHQLASPDLADRVSDALARHGVEPALLCLELTESAVMADAGAADAALHRLKGIGIQIAIDDFGTGYSSLAYLKRFPVDFLKVDKSFVAGLGQDPDDTAIVMAVVDLARSLGMRVVAEGVETPEQLAELRRLGCDVGQGFLWTVPLPGPELVPFLRSAADERARG